MNYIYHILFTIFIAICIGCQDIKVGYLDTIHAEYSIDSMEINRFSNFIHEIDSLKLVYQKFCDKAGTKLPDFYHQEELLKTKEPEKQRLLDLYYSAQAQYDEYVAQGGSDLDLLKKLEEQMNEAEQIYYAYLDKEIRPVENAIWTLRRDLNLIGQELDITRPLELPNLIVGLQKQIDDDLPWVTSTIEGILGTQPLHYKIHSIHCDQPGAANDFKNYISIIGGGRMFVRAKVDSPAGKYKISLIVYNEDHEQLLENVFTFILK